MDYRYLARLIALGRIGIGGVLLAFPGVVRLWIGPAAADTTVTVLTRAAGARDLALGIAALKNLSSGDAPGDAVRAGAAVDAADALATLLACKRLPQPVGAGVVALASSAAAIGFRAVAEGPQR